MRERLYTALGALSFFSTKGLLCHLFRDTATRPLTRPPNTEPVHTHMHTHTLSLTHTHTRTHAHRYDQICACRYARGRGLCRYDRVVRTDNLCAVPMSLLRPMLLFPTCLTPRPLEIPAPISGNFRFPSGAHAGPFQEEEVCVCVCVCVCDDTSKHPTRLNIFGGIRDEF